MGYHLITSAGGYDYVRDSSRESGAEFYGRMGPFFASRAVHKELGGPMYDDDRYTWILVLKDGRVVGWGAVLLQKADTVFLDWSYVVPEHRKQGIYATILRLRLELAKELGARIVRGATSTDMIRKIYVKRGFAVWQERGKWTYYQKELS